jgi:pyrimidine deaminase RibD-like protein
MKNYLCVGSENKVWDNCKRSISELRKLDEYENIKNGEHPYVSCIILDSFGNILKDSKGNEIITLTDPDVRNPSRVHAEAKAIRWILSDKDLRKKACTLITTLEPCSYRNVKNHPEEVACSKLISYAGIKQVVVGTLDPAPEISGRGLKIMEQWGVYVTFFPCDLHSDILRINKKYLKKNASVKNRYYINPIYEFSINHAPLSVQKYLKSNIFVKNTFKSSENKKDLSKKIFSIDELTSEALEIVDELKKKKNNQNISIYEKIAEYLGLPVDKEEVFRNKYILTYVIEWYFELHRQRQESSDL